MAVTKRVYPGPVAGHLNPPADKSISHRALIFSALASGVSRISNLLRAGDVLSTSRCLQALGVTVQQSGDQVLVHGQAGCFSSPRGPLQVGNSGTTLRLMTGALAAQPLQVLLSGDHSLNRRPLQRVLQPLRLMGVKAYCTPAGTAPVLLLGQRLRGIDYRLPVASAQLKSALLLAALQADGETTIIDPVPSRDHSERMLMAMGINLSRYEGQIKIRGHQQLLGRDLAIPGDISSAAPFITAAALCPGSVLRVSAVGLNPTRIGLLHVLRRMGADIRITITSDDGNEPLGNVLVQYNGQLSGIEVLPEEIPLLIDEVPLLVVAACLAEGDTVIGGVGELRVKESDRVEGIVQPLRLMGARIEVKGDVLRVQGQSQRFSGHRVLSGHADHRLAMALAVAATVADGPVGICGAEWVSISYPDFFHQLARLQREAKAGCAF
ncbi:MAG: 3-phosphoshikimate 1-carboxyvinyltransferase [Bacillota bacterium]|jgi:3-phosphoshikimate 1-carboxyvinyltransferase